MPAGVPWQATLVHVLAVASKVGAGWPAAYAGPFLSKPRRPATLWQTEQANAPCFRCAPVGVQAGSPSKQESPCVRPAAARPAPLAPPFSHPERPSTARAAIEERRPRQIGGYAMEPPRLEIGR